MLYIVETAICRYAGNNKIYKFDNLTEAKKYAEKKQKKTKNSVNVYKVISTEIKPCYLREETYTIYKTNKVYDGKTNTDVISSLPYEIREY